MKSKIILGIAGIALLAGGVYLGNSMANKSSPVTAMSNGAPQTPGLGLAGNDAPEAAGKKTSRKREEESSWAKLTEKYGDGKTKLSKKITQDMAGMLDDAMELADMGAELGGATSARALASKQALESLTAKLGLTDEQKARVADIVAERVGKRMDAVKELTTAMRDDPGGMMETILAGDAYSRKEITEEEYKQASEETLAVLKNVSGFALSGRGAGSDITDPLLAEQLRPVLGTDQQKQLDDLMQQAEAAKANSNRPEMPFQNGNLPAMELEKLDQTMASAQKLTTGLKAMMEGFKGLKSANPVPTEH
jgi:hypothetical protein